MDAPDSIEQIRVRRVNNFDAIRLFAACLVLYGHAFALTGHPAPGIAGVPVQAIGIKIFFVISGFLITKSWVSDPNVMRYFLRRSLRIFPGLIGVVAVTTLAIGPLTTSLPLSSYFTNRGVASYWSNVALYYRPALPGVFTENRYPSAVNGSLWSLAVEFAAYIILPVLLPIGLRSGRIALTIASAAMCVALLLIRHSPSADAPPLVYGVSVFDALGVLPYFFIGSLFTVWRLERFCNLQIALTLVLICALAGRSPMQSEFLLMIALPVATLSLAIAPQPLFANAGRFGDFSYGLYLYAFPVQQVVEAVSSERLSPTTNFAVSGLIATSLAVASWHVIEKHALKLKPRRHDRRRDS